MNNPWFRMYHDFATNPKVQMLSEDDQRRFAMLIFLDTPDGGTPLEDYEVAFQLRIEGEDWSHTKKTLLVNGLIDEDNRPMRRKKRKASGGNRP